MLSGFGTASAGLHCCLYANYSSSELNSFDNDIIPSMRRIFIPIVGIPSSLQDLLWTAAMAAWAVQLAKAFAPFKLH